MHDAAYHDSPQYQSSATHSKQKDLLVNAGDHVFFEFDSYMLSNAAMDTLARQAEWLEKNPEVGLIVEGHCDIRGTREYNLALGERRANSVQKYLVDRGIESSRINVVSYGKGAPCS